MKKAYVPLAIIAGTSVVCTSCVVPSYGYSTYSVPGNVSAGVAWTNASYDAAGFPIFGYSYGRPVYGYTEAGAAVFTIAALTALCFVPYWGPASWYRGYYRYPYGIHRVPAPPRFPAGHAPGVRPPGGIKPPPAPGAPKPGWGGGNFPKPPTSHGPHIFPKSGTSTMPAPGVGPKGFGPGSFSIPKPGASVSPGKPNPGVGGVHFPKPATPNVSSSSSGAPRMAHPMGTGFSIPKPAGVTAPPTVRIGPPAASGASSPRISTMPAPSSVPRISTMPAPSSAPKISTVPTHSSAPRISTMPAPAMRKP